MPSAADIANYDEAAIAPYTLPSLSDDPTTPLTADAARTAQARWRNIFADGLYGAIPSPPGAIGTKRRVLPRSSCHHLQIEVTVGGRSLTVDAALWLPSNSAGPFPTMVALDFIGPLGTLQSHEFPLDPSARIARQPWLGGGHGPLLEVMRGTSGHRIPVDLLTGAGYAVLTSCYGSWVPDDPVEYRTGGVWQLLDLDNAASPPGVVALWAWSLGRLIDVAVDLPEIDATRIAIAGHSRLGKAALWAGANDERAAAVFVNESGCAGASLSRRNYGETLELNRSGFPHWLLAAERADAAGLDAVDQHQLLAAIAPRSVYVGSAEGDRWCDPRGEYLALRAAAPMWTAFGSNADALPEADQAFVPGNAVVSGKVGWHLRDGGHDLTPYDWSRFLDFLAVQPGFGRP